jgi:predicted amidophosphoribosyltransferase
MSKSYPKLEFVNRITIPDRINPIIQYNLRREREALGELGFLCPKCKSVLSEDATECENCGEIFTVTEYQCPNCTAEVDSSDLFCPKCGSKFEELEVEEEEPVVDDEADTEKEPEEVEVDDKEPPETLEAISEVDKDVDKQDKKLAVKSNYLKV